MADTRSVWLIDGAGTVYVDEQPIPEPGAGEVLVEVEASLVSAGTEGAMIDRRRESPNSDRPDVPLGYQNAGIVVETGAGVERFGPGDRVACMGNRAAMHTEYAAVPCNLTVHLPEDVSFEAGAFNHLAATALHGVRRTDLELGEYVVVMGLGIVGNMVAQLAQVSGCHAIGIDPLTNRAETARAVGIEEAIAVEEEFVERVTTFTHGYGMDAGFICFGGEATDALDTLIDVAKRAPDGHEMGRIVVIGGAEITKSFPVPVGNMDIRAASRTGPGYKDEEYERGHAYPSTIVEWTTRRNLEEIVRLLARERLRVEPLITDRYHHENIAEAYEGIVQRPEESIGGVITY